MLSVYDKGPFAPCPAPFNLAAHVLAAGQKTPGKEALLILSDSGVERWSHAQVCRAVLGTAAGLLSEGCKPGDIILMRLGNTVDFPIAYLGALAAGMVPVPTSSALTAAESAVLIETVKPALILRAPEVACAAGLREISLDALQAFRDLPPAPFHMSDPNRLGYIVFTSGTGGTPRAVAHAHRAIWARQMMFDAWYGLGQSDRLLHAGAFNWTYTLGTGLMDPWTCGATALIPTPGTRPEALPGLLKAHQVSIFAAAPGVYRQVLERSPELPDLPALRHGLSAGEKLPLPVAQQWRRATGTQVYEAFGMSECSTFISQAPAKPVVDGTLGCPQPGRRIALLQDGEPVPRGVEGTIAIHKDDPGLMLGYFNAEDATRRRFTGDWFLTGDQAVMGPEDHITYMGRNDDMMNAGGFRVSPVEVEDVLAGYPGIENSAVTAVTVKQDTEVIAAFYTGPAALDAKALDRYVSKQLARYKQPRLYIHLPTLPLGANGKILRRALRTRFERPE